MLLCSPYPVPSPHGHVIACRITSENPDEVSTHFVRCTSFVMYVLYIYFLCMCVRLGVYHFVSVYVLSTVYICLHVCMHTCIFLYVYVHAYILLYYYTFSF